MWQNFGCRRIAWTLIVKFPAFLLLIILPFVFSCKKEFSCENCQYNQPPISNAGTDQIITLPKDSVMLDGTTSTDPEGSITSYIWTNVSGPVSSSTVKPGSSKTLMKGLVMGVYKFESTVSDNGGSSGKDSIQIIVNDPTVNQPRIAKAGVDQTITLSTDSVTLNGRIRTGVETGVLKTLGS